MANVDGAFARFSLIGGPFHALSAAIAPRLGRAARVTVGTGLSVLLWLILAALASAAGAADRFFSLETTAVHVRMLVVVPLILWCTELFDRAVQNACLALVERGIIAGATKAALDADALRLMRFNKTWWVQLGLMAGVIIAGLLAPLSFLPGTSSSASNLSSMPPTIAGYWYWLVCLPAFRFVMARFLCLWAVWVVLLWHLSRRELSLRALHPDRAGGLGLIEVAQAQLAVFVLAIGVIDAAALAETFQTVAPNHAQVYLHVFLVTQIGLVVICAPLLLLVSMLYRCRRRAMVEFSALAYDYARLFQQRWIEPDRTETGNPLGSGDIQSLADLASAYETLRTMRVLPVTLTLVWVIIGAATLPHLPLLLLEYSIGDLITDLVEAMIGA
jgi:hypothetical protein